MRILLDECLPKKLKKEFQNYDVKTVPEMGWSGKKNGELLSLAEAHFEILITADQNLRYQQNLKGRSIIIFVLKSPNSRYETVRSLIPEVIEKISGTTKSEIIEIEYKKPL